MKSNGSGLSALIVLMFIALGCSGLKNMLPKKGQYFEGDGAWVRKNGGTISEEK